MLKWHGRCSICDKEVYNRLYRSSAGPANKLFCCEDHKKIWDRSWSEAAQRQNQQDILFANFLKDRNRR